jgi:hypothetical protein
MCAHQILQSLSRIAVQYLTLIFHQHTEAKDVITSKGTCMSIDVAIPGDRNVITKEYEKIVKYKDLTI